MYIQNELYPAGKNKLTRVSHFGISFLIDGRPILTKKENEKVENKRRGAQMLLKVK